MITIYYNSGKKSQLITNEAHKKVCKAIIWGKNVERSIVDIIRKHKPEEVSSEQLQLLPMNAKNSVVRIQTQFYKLGLIMIFCLSLGTNFTKNSH